ncbi:hypothetical protein MYY11_002670 [Enterococcus faecium]|nr:hypothetical protein [Enterococcus faecium]
MSWVKQTSTSVSSAQTSVQNLVESLKNAQDTNHSNLVTNGDFETGNTTG